MFIGGLIPFFVGILLIATIISPKWGLILMLCCYILMPEIPLNIGIQLKKNHVLMLVLSVFFLRYVLFKKSKIHVRPFMFCFLYLGINLMLVPLKETSITIQLYYITYDAAIVLFFPIAIWAVMKNENNTKAFRTAFVLCIMIVAIYGLFLLSTKGLNPWTMLFSVLQGNDADFWVRYYADDNRIFGRISSVFFHPMHYAAFLGFSLIYVLFIRNKIPKFIFYLIILSLLVNIITCGVRSVLGALFVTIIFYVLITRHVGLTFRIVLYLSIVLIVAMSIPGMDTYLASIFSKPENSSVGGSSIEMRLGQLKGAFIEINNNPLFGKGYGWCREYTIRNGNHPILIAFESIIFVVLCNNGIIGLFLLFMLGLLYYHYVSHHIEKKDQPLFLCIIVFYYIYETITGEFAFQYLLLFYTFMLYDNYSNKLTKHNKIYESLYIYNLCKKLYRSGTGAREVCTSV